MIGVGSSRKNAPMMPGGPSQVERAILIVYVGDDGFSDGKCMFSTNGIFIGEQFECVIEKCYFFLQFIVYCECGCHMNGQESGEKSIERNTAAMRFFCF